MPVDMSIPNSIVQAFLAGASIKHQKFAEERQTEQDVLAEKHRQTQEKQAQQQLDAFVKNLEEQQKMHRDTLELQHKGFNLSVREAIGKEIQQGLRRPSTTQEMPAIPSTVPGIPSTPEVTVPTPGAAYNVEGVSIPQSEFYSVPERRAAELATLRQGLQAQTEAKIAEAKGEQPLKLEQIEATGKQHIAQAQATAQSALLRTLATVEGRHTDVAATNAARIAAANIKAQNKPGQDPETIKENALAAALGEANLTGMSANDMTVRSTLRKMNFTPFGAKESDTLKSQHDVDSLYQDMMRLADKLPESRLGAVVTFIQSKIPNDEIKMLQDRIRGVAGNVARTQGGERGVLTERDLTRALGLLVSGGMTKQNALNNIQAFRDREINKINEVVLGRVTNPLQRLLVLQKHDFDPETYGGSVSYKGQQIPFFKKYGDSYVYFKNGSYHPVTEAQ